MVWFQLPLVPHWPVVFKEEHNESLKLEKVVWNRSIGPVDGARCIVRYGPGARAQGLAHG